MATADTTTIRVPTDTRDRLKALAAQRGESASEVVATRTDFDNPLHVEVPAAEAGLKERGFAMPEQLRAISHERPTHRLGNLRPKTLEELLKHCRVLLR